ncbi:hypothetical protein D0T12_21690 [Actinomadura spongiicola]|uniref:Uncharacterized protein n=1 Tax=Actinomadura spongiicola TaxID=2303421 RepID=A0A372GE36_9ACTN|nr:hypothetical protein D0T12_21690 [Actinomadura spongiicola]
MRKFGERGRVGRGLPERGSVGDLLRPRERREGRQVLFVRLRFRGGTQPGYDAGTVLVVVRGVGPRAAGLRGVEGRAAGEVGHGEVGHVADRWRRRRRSLGLFRFVEYFRWPRWTPVSREDLGPCFLGVADRLVLGRPADFADHFGPAGFVLLVVLGEPVRRWGRSRQVLGRRALIG